jgi:nitrogen-specific signal transduction histidine kinase
VFEYDSPSVLSHFEPADLLDALSIGLTVLDAQLCVIYANVAAQDALAFRVDQARGRPIGDLLDESSSLVATLRRALETGECIAHGAHPVRPFGRSRYASGLDVTITPLGSQVTGTHLLLEFTGAAKRQTIPRDNDLNAGPGRESVRGPVAWAPLPHIPR